MCLIYLNNIYSFSRKRQQNKKEGEKVKQTKKTEWQIDMYICLDFCHVPQ